MEQKSHSSISHKIFHIHYNNCLLIKGLFHEEMFSKNSLAVKNYLHSSGSDWKEGSHTWNNTRETKTQRKGIIWDHKTSAGQIKDWPVCDYEATVSSITLYYDGENYKEHWTKIKAKFMRESRDCLDYYIYGTFVRCSFPQIPNLCSAWCLIFHH